MRDIYIRRYSDRIGRHLSIRLTWRFTFGIVRHPAMMAWSGYFFRRRWCFRPIDYAAIDAWNARTAKKDVRS